MYGLIGMTWSLLTLPLMSFKWHRLEGKTQQPPYWFCLGKAVLPLKKHFSVFPPTVFPCIGHSICQASVAWLSCCNNLQSCHSNLNYWKGNLAIISVACFHVCWLLLQYNKLVADVEKAKATTQVRWTLLSNDLHSKVCMPQLLWFFFYFICS